MNFLIFLTFICLNAFAEPIDYPARTRRLYFQVTSKPLLTQNPIYQNLLKLVFEGKEKEAVSMMMADPNFINTVSRSWAVRYLSSNQSTSAPLTDALAMVIGSIRDNRDFREILTGDYTYGAISRLGLDLPALNSNGTYSRIDAGKFSLHEVLKRYEPQWDNNGFQNSAGTNRRAVVGALSVFLCKPIETWKTSFLDTSWIRRDVSRAPSGDARIFQQECRTCHSAMDGLAGAFAYLDYTNQLAVSMSVVKKYNQNEKTHPEGFVTMDDRWVNLLTVRDQLDFGWRGKTSGKGLKEFAQMLAESKAFSKCVAERSLSYFCAKDLSLSDPIVETFADQFEKEDGYRMKDFFSRVVTSKECQ